MNIEYEIEKMEKEPKYYTQKLIDHHLNNHSLTKDEYKQELLACIEPEEINRNIIETTAQRLGFNVIDEERRYKGVLVITPYEIYFIGYGLFYQKPASEKVFLNTKFLYEMYEHVYQDPTRRIKLVYEMGPKLSFDEFKKRHDYWKKTTSN